MTSSQTLPQNSLAGNPKTIGLPNIAFVGKAGAGKTTGAELLQELGYVRLSFAAPLKDVAAKLWGDEARTDRDKLQKLGVAVREIDPDTWVNLLTGQLRDERTRSFGNTGVFAPKPKVIDDCRFENEWYALKAEGFVIVRVTASTASRIDRLKSNGKWQDEGQLAHASETAVDHLDEDYWIENLGSKDEYYDDLVDIILKERKRR